MNKELLINEEDLQKARKNYAKSKKDIILTNALSKTNMLSVISILNEENNIDQMFSIDNKTLPVCDQKQSGRCWIFAGCNILREIVGKKINVDSFELSQNYISFYDKLEKVNYTFNTLITLADKDPFDRELMYILQNGIGDGGQWDMFADIIRKYGICPKSAYRETFASSHTKESNDIINSVIRQFAVEVHNLHLNKQDNKIYALKEIYMSKIYNLLIDCFGLPPTKFDFEYVDKKGTYHLEKSFTPKSFSDKFIGDEISNYVSIINSPTKDKPYNKSFTIKYLGNVAEGNIVKHLNLPMERIKELIITSLMNKELVWFGSDVASYRNRELGAWDDKLFDYENSFDLDIKFSKEDMLNYHQSAMNHAMVICGVNLINKVPNKWKIENSWGETGQKGFYVMSASWFDRYVYQAVINKKYLSLEELASYNKKPIMLDPWDPMGTLAD
jgi:bleomycin hydrolase